MERTTKLSFLVLLLSSAIIAVHVAATTTVDLTGDFLTCRGSIADCSSSSFLVGEEDEGAFGFEEFEMESESSRRILASRRYISYGAMRRNSVPCSRRGASYYNCRRGAQANPYSRGCSRITRCRR